MGKQDKIEEAKDAVAEAIWSESMDERQRQRMVATAEALGAFKAVLSVGRSLTAVGFNRLREFVDEEGYKELGFPTVVEFFASGSAGMSKNQYYDRLSAFTREGEAVFELLNSIGMPLSHRKLLGNGEIRIDGEDVVVGHDDREERVAITDRLALKSLIAGLAEKSSNSEQRIAQLEKKSKQGEADFKKLQKQLEEARRRGVPTSGTRHGKALLVLKGAYDELRDAVVEYAEAVEPGSDGDEEFHGFFKTTIEIIGASYMELTDAFGIVNDAKPEADSDLNLSGEEAADLLEN